MANGDILKLVVTNLGKYDTEAEILLHRPDTLWYIADNGQPGKYSIPYAEQMSVADMEDMFGMVTLERHGLVTGA